MTRHAELERAANDQVEDLLEAYAEARLTPTGPVLARIRSNVLAEAAAAAAARRLVAVDATPRPRFALFQGRVPRRAFALGMAATLTLGTTAAVIAAPPGSPFYNARLVIEAALLPTQIDARLAAYEQHLEARLKEAEAAAAAGDSAGLAAALAAYGADMAAVVAQVGDDNAAWLAHLEAVLAKHADVLEALAARLPEQASIDNAIENSQKTIEKIREKARHGNGGPPSDTPDGPPDNPGAP